MKDNQQQSVQIGNYIILEEFIETKENYSSHKCKFKCKTCETEYISRKSRIKDYVCKECKRKNYTNDFIGYSRNGFIILSFSHTDGKRIYYNCRCKCGNIVKLTITHLKSRNSEKCKKCAGNNRQIITNHSVVMNKVYKSYSIGKNAKLLGFSLTKDEFFKLIFQTCYYCGDSPREYKEDTRVNKTGIPYLRNGIDRINSTKGYTLDNSITCCSACNMMKNNLPIEVFYDKITKIYNNLNKCSTTIPEGSTSQVNGDGNGEDPNRIVI